VWLLYAELTHATGVNRSACGDANVPLCLYVAGLQIVFRLIRVKRYSIGKHENRFAFQVNDVLPTYLGVLSQEAVWSKSLVTGVLY